jgi:ubiquinone/menaquinone biosynthesis C-methylase UbiE
MMAGDVEFDRIAPIYDDTRRPPTREELNALAELLGGCRTVLDAGVGTGRFAVPLRARRFEIIGADISLGMMRRARDKGISTLVRADVCHLPLSDKAVDATFMSHVLQFIPEPRGLFEELGRVTRKTIVILLPEWSERRPTGGWRELRERYRELAAELGYPLPERGTRYRHTLEELSAISPPRSVKIVAGPPPSERTPEERFARWAGMAFGGNQVPPEVHTEIVRRLRAEHPVDPAGWAGPREARFVAWDAQSLNPNVVR